jgi:hypothetical protein
MGGSIAPSRAVPEIGSDLIATPAILSSKRRHIALASSRHSCDISAGVVGSQQR